MNGRLGDIQTRDRDPLETYFDILRQGVSLPRNRWIVPPEWCPPSIPGVEALQRFYEDHQLPRQWQLLMDLWQKFQCGTFYVKRPDWIEAPVTARIIDLRNETAHLVTPVDTLVVSFTVPDRFYGTLQGFGHVLTNPASWGFVVWNIRVNNEPIPAFQDFLQQIGDTKAPTLWTSPFRVTPLQVVTVTARNPAGPATSAFVRLTGFQFPAKVVTQDGSFAEYHTI